MTHSAPTEFENVTAVTKANIYFDGGVVSHTLLFADGSRKTLGLIFPGTYEFKTEAAEQMDIIVGSCLVQLEGESDWTTYNEGQSFHVPANSSFQIDVLQGETQYICSFL